MQLLRTLFLLLCLLAGKLSAQVMQTRAYHIPPDFPARPFSDRETYDPFTHPIPDYNDDSLRVLEAAGVTFPPGASCQFDMITELLTVHNTRENLALVDKHVGELIKIHPRTLRWHLSIVEAPVGKLSLDTDATTQLIALRQASAQPDSGLRWLANAMVEGKGGTRVTHEFVKEHAILTPPVANKKGGHVVSVDAQNNGTRLEIEGTVSPDGTIIEANLAIHAPVPAPVEQTVKAGGAQYDTLIQREAAWITGVTFAAGATKLLGISSSPWDEKKQVGAFLTCQVLDYHLGDLYSLFEGSPPEIKPPTGMTAVTLHMPSGSYAAALPGREHDSLLTWLDTTALKPPGSRFQLEANRLHLINTPENIRRIALVAHHLHSRLPKNIRVMVHTIKAAPDSLPLASANDDDALYSHLEKAVDQGHAQFIDSRVFEVTGGTAMTHNTADEQPFITELNSDAESNPWPNLDTRNAGSLLEFEPTVGVDMQHIEVSLSHQLHSAAPQIHRSRFAAAASEKTSELPLTNFQHCRTITGLTLQNGGQRLFSIQQPPLQDSGDALWFTFVRADIALQHSPPRPRAPEPIALPPPAPSDPNELEVRFYRVPPDFLGSEPKKTAKEILEEMGITFPKGSSATFIPASSQLVVKNTRANLDLVDAYVDDTCRLPIRGVEVTSHVIEAPGPLLRSIAFQAAKLGNHESLLVNLLAMPEVKKLDLSHIEGKGGTRFTTTSGSQITYLDKFEPDKHGSLQIIQKLRQSGLELEFEPSIDPSLHFIHLNLKGEWHTAPPTQLAEHLTDAKGRRFDLPLTVFHTHTLTSGFVMSDGTTHLVSMWKATGQEKDVLQALFITTRIVR
jgi:hypothetical protein